jgi:hypothetical protein
MDREDIIKLAREAGIEFYPSPTNDVRFCLLKNLERFAALVIAAEREVCAKLVEADGLARGSEGLVLIKAAGRIRARGNT